MSSTSPTNTASPLPRAKARRWQIVLARTAFVVAVLVTLLAGYHIVENRRGEAMWQAYQAEAREHGTKLALDACIPPPVPDERNFAAIPIFQDAFKKSPPFDRWGWVQDLLHRPQPLNPLDWPPAGNVTPPLMGATDKGELIDLRAWQKFVAGKKMLAATTDNPAADVLKALDLYAPQLEQLRVAGQRPDSRFPVDYAAGISAVLPHLQILRSAARIDCLRLTAHLALGDSPAAYADFREGFRLSTALEKEPTLISALVRLSILNMEENAVAAGLARHQWGDAELEKITADLGHLRLLDNYALAVGGERGFNNMLHEQLIHTGSGGLARLLAEAGGGQGTNNRLGAALFSLYPAGWLRMSQTRSNRFFDEMLARVSQDPPRIFSKRPVPDRPVAAVNFFERVRYVLFLLLAPALDTVERTCAYGQTLLDETRLGCALERHRLAHGSFPPLLDTLVPAFLPALPQDVMSGAPLHYRLEAKGGYTLYSVGWNLRDDGGKFEAKKTSARDQPDWVWTVPGK